MLVHRVGEEVAKFCVAVAGVLMAFAAFYLPHIPVDLYFVPWQHDDFLGLNPLHSIWSYRIVSIDTMHWLASLGWGPYYAAYTALLVSNIALTARFVEVFASGSPTRARYLFTLGLSFLAAAVWFLNFNSAIVFQYLGLITNGLSFFFGILAAIGKRHKAA